VKVVYLPIPGPVGYFRGLAPAAALAARGHDVTVITPELGLTREQGGDLIREADVVVMLSASSKITFEERPDYIQEMTGILVVDLDDDVWAWREDPASYDPGQLELSKRAGKLMDEKAIAHVESWLRGADLVTTTTTSLAVVLRDHGAREVAVCRNAVSPEMLPPEKKIIEMPADMSSAKKFLARGKARREQKAEEFRPIPGISPGKRLAWTGSVAHKADVGSMLVALREVMSVDATVGCMSLGPVVFHATTEWAPDPITNLGGFDPRDRYQAITSMMMFPDRPPIVSLTVPFAAYYQNLDQMAASVALVPMRPSRLNASKSDVTLLSWACRGVPTIASACPGAYLQAALDGFPASFIRDHDDVKEWRKAIEQLIYDPITARVLGEKARQYVIEKRSIEQEAVKWEAAFAKALEAKRTRSPAA
jgi:glycosyltransferase involved in cell wall biosynthesis